MDVMQAISGSFSGVEPDLEIKPGALVRSYDFAGSRDSYAQGVVEAITEPMEGCLRYKIAVRVRVFGGAPVEEHEEHVYPPVNGTLTWTGKVTNYVERVQS